MEKGCTLPDKRATTPKNIALYTRRSNMIYDCVMYVQTQYVDLYITGSEHASLPIRPLYEDAVRERKER